MEPAEGRSDQADTFCKELKTRHLWHSEVIAFRDGSASWVSVDWCVRCGVDRPDMTGPVRKYRRRWRHVENVKPTEEAQGLL